MADLTLSAPVAYYGGTGSASLMLGYIYNGGGVNCVLRYSFTTPASGYITALKFTTKFRYYSGDTGYTRPVRVKVTTSDTSHVNAGESTTDYDAEYAYSVTTSDTAVTIAIGNLKLSPNTTYYLYLFPGSGYKNDGSSKNGQYTVYCYDNDKNDLSALESAAMLSGLVHIDNGESWGDYEVYIDDGESWAQYIPYIDDGESWVMCN